MISFRYHVVSIVSILLALAVGVVLGAGPLQGRTDDTLVDRAATDRAARSDLSGQVTALRRAEDFNDGFASTVAPRVVDRSLSGHEVTLVALPTADQADVAGMVRLVAVAGGRVGGTLRIRDPLLDVSQKELVDELGTQLEGQAAGLKVPADAGAYERIGALLGRAAGTRERGGAPVDGTAGTVLAGLQTAKLVSGGSALKRRGDLVLFVTGGGRGTPEAQKGAATILTTVVRAVDGQTGGTVLAGPPATVEPGGQVAALRADAATRRAVSTVDALGGTAGRLVTVLALAGQAAGRTGHYGATDAPDGVLPTTAAPR